MKRCGYVALVGRPNAGKSTLLNALLGAKVSVVSSKPQTTRNRILGVYTDEEVGSQIIFLDTPGMHRAEGLPRIHRAMNRAAWAALEDASVACYLVDVELGWKDDDTRYFKGVLERAKGKVVVLVTKVDSIKKDAVLVSSAEIENRVMAVVETVPGSREKLSQESVYLVSSKRPQEVSGFRKYLSGYMPEAEWLFEADDLTDRPQRFLCGEIIREQLFRQLGQELPYSSAVRIDQFESTEKIVHIAATIVVQRDTHKAIVIGKKGARLKEIGTEARLGLEKHLGQKVHLDLFVKVQVGWLDDDRLLAEYAALEAEG
jgi:GTP-binding protein Era